MYRHFLRINLQLMIIVIIMNYIVEIDFMFALDLIQLWYDNNY